ncbi:aminoacyl-tRNA hydrolase [Tsukamurella sp. 8F]|uniref:aminoacyl-tRNA hydrolase n=1 Tax=unclassified Tsukamurella TaxID=2633480 RepID=UPI0023B94BA8|nr:MULTISPECIES: aminoacyl-tRNA hydrolase [unclassified Tsukamurella]MDF0530253.1 aminoacyl-tRNA hydrolase [Tsukamurella sp. 8J]MDF0586570.1 aminoacyl-tRNA hydrolase [Tsukamurella sp. 8F]
MTDAPLIVVGLGNPGEKYAATRHNIGFWVADELAGRAHTTFSRHKKSGAEVATARLAGRTVYLAKPQSFMNLSGQPTAALARFFSVAPTDVIAVHDELDIAFGAVRLKRGGGEGGHNGLRSLTQHLGTKDYLRVRAGIGRPPGRMDAADYVLKPFSAAERKEVPLLVAGAADAVELLISGDLETAQNTVHAW